MSMNNPECRVVWLEEAGDTVGALYGNREGWRLRTGMIGTGGVGRSLEDRRRAAISSSSKTVASVRVLIGRKCSSVTFCLGWFDDLAGAGQPSSSALIARPICDIGTEVVLFEVPTPGRTIVRFEPEVEIPRVLKGDGVTRRGYLGASRGTVGGGGPIAKLVEEFVMSSTFT